MKNLFSVLAGALVSAPKRPKRFSQGAITYVFDRSVDSGQAQTRLECYDPAANLNAKLTPEESKAARRAKVLLRCCARSVKGGSSITCDDFKYSVGSSDEEVGLTPNDLIELDGDHSNLREGAEAEFLLLLPGLERPEVVMLRYGGVEKRIVFIK